MKDGINKNIIKNNNQTVIKTKKSGLDNLEKKSDKIYNKFKENLFKNIELSILDYEKKIIEELKILISNILKKIIKDNKYSIEKIMNIIFVNFQDIIKISLKKLQNNSIKRENKLLNNLIINLDNLYIKDTNSLDKKYISQKKEGDSDYNKIVYNLNQSINKLNNISINLEKNIMNIDKNLIDNIRDSIKNVELERQNILEKDILKTLPSIIIDPMEDQSKFDEFEKNNSLDKNNMKNIYKFKKKEKVLDFVSTIGMANLIKIYIYVEIYEEHANNYFYFVIHNNRFISKEKFYKDFINGYNRYLEIYDEKTSVIINWYVVPTILLKDGQPGKEVLEKNIKDIYLNL